MSQPNTSQCEITHRDFIVGFSKEKADAMLTRLDPEDHNSLFCNIRRAHARGRWGDALIYWNEYVLLYGKR